MDGSVELQDGELTIVSVRRQFRLSEAVHIVREVSGAGDAHELLGRVKTRAYLEQLGAEIVETSMLLGDAAYDVEPGWMGVPVGPFALRSSGAKVPAGAANGNASRGEPTSDEDILARLVTGNL